MACFIFKQYRIIYKKYVEKTLSRFQLFSKWNLTLGGIGLKNLTCPYMGVGGGQKFPKSSLHNYDIVSYRKRGGKMQIKNCMDEKRNETLEEDWRDSENWQQNITGQI